MNKDTPERHALRGLLLALVEVQNMVRGAGDNELREFVRIQDHVESDHVREYVQLARAVLDTPAESGWQPIEQAPKHKWLLCGRSGGGSKFGRFVGYICENGDCVDSNDGLRNPTHWMPLPPPPASPRPIPAEQAGVHV